MAVGFYFDMTRCIGCKTCQIACKDKNDLPTGTIFREIMSYEGGEYPKVKSFHYSASCNHCGLPACMEACPSGAIYKNEEDAVLIDTSICDGCGACVEACPYRVPKIMDNGVAGKCDSCVAIRVNGNQPQCVAACPMRALDFGDLAELMNKYEDWSMITDFPFLPESETAPGTLVKVKAASQDPSMIRMDY